MPSMPRPRRSESTRQALIEAGINQLSSHGYHGTGIKQILDEVKVPKGSFYNFFASKEAFVAELIKVYNQHFVQQVTQFFQQEGAELDSLGKLKTITLYSLAKYEKAQFKHSCLIATLSADLDDSNQLCQVALNQAVEACIDIFTDLIEQAQLENTVRKDIEARQLAKIYWSTWQGALLRMRVSKNKQEAEDYMLLLLESLFIKASG